MEGIPIAVVEQETGLSKDVLRKWEARYNYPLPTRNLHGDRVYSRDQVTHLRAVKRLMEKGYRPSRLLSMSLDELAELTASTTATQSSDQAASAVSELLGLLQGHELIKFRAALKRLLQSQGLKQFVQDTVAPLATMVGEAWSEGKIHVFEEHLFSDIAASTLRQALEAIDLPEGNPRIILTTVPGEGHALGLLMAACLFTLKGAHCIYLGTETPSEDIVLAAQAHGAHAVALSFSSAFPVRQIQPALLDLRSRLDQEIEILAGGVGITRQKKTKGILLLPDLASIDQYIPNQGA
ncbi:MAG: cobalamin B12-binding domain-containing protein [Betaproteobacteria bacterium]|nr:cobalamin B12-binding domain-containing protein [Betaproteobacteria bacterium]MDE2622778.1 cobalamin B12-binding domain-containing protein [Betaproteobacteria bacterium]